MGTDFVLDPFIFDRVEIIPAVQRDIALWHQRVLWRRERHHQVRVGARWWAGRRRRRHAWQRLGASELWTTVNIPGLDVALPAALVRTDGAWFALLSGVHVEPDGGVVRDLDGEQARQVAGRIGVGALTVSAAFGTREKNVPTAAYGTAFGDPRFRTTDTRAFLDARYTATAKATRFDFRGTLDRYRYAGEYPTAVRVSDTVVLDDYADGVWAGIETRASRTFGSRHDVTAGVEFRHDLRQRQGGADAGTPTPTTCRIGRHNGRVRAG